MQVEESQQTDSYPGPAVGLVVLKKLHRLTFPHQVAFIAEAACKAAFAMALGKGKPPELLTALMVLRELALDHPSQYPGAASVLQEAREAVLGQLEPDPRLVALYALPYRYLNETDKGYCRGVADLYDSLIGHSDRLTPELERMKNELAIRLPDGPAPNVMGWAPGTAEPAGPTNAPGADAERAASAAADDTETLGPDDHGSPPPGPSDKLSGGDDGAPEGAPLCSASAQAELTGIDAGEPSDPPPAELGGMQAPAEAI